MKVTVNYLVVSLVGSTALACWKLYLDYRQRRRTIQVDPDNLNKAKVLLKMTEDEYKKAKEYQKDRLTFSMVTEVIDTCINVGLLATKAMPFIWDKIHGTLSIDGGGFMHSLIFSIVIDLITTILALPQSYYSAFVIEEKHGFNKQTKKTFVLDLIKNTALRWIFMHPITNALLYFVVKHFGISFPNYLFIGGTVLSIIFIYIYPVLIQPLFNKYVPLKDGELKDGITKMAEELHFPLTKIYEVDGSKRSGHSNAYFYGFFNCKRIVLYDTILKHLNTEEILAVLGHEFGHWHHNHTTMLLGTGLAQFFTICHFLKLSFFEPRLLTDFGFGPNNTKIPGSNELSPVLCFTVLNMVILEQITTLLSIAVNAMSRRMEFQADRFAVQKLKRGQCLREGLIKLSKENKGNVDPDWLYATCHYSHPPTLERLSIIEEQCKKSE